MRRGHSPAGLPRVCGWEEGSRVWLGVFSEDVPTSIWPVDFRRQLA